MARRALTGKSLLLSGACGSGKSTLMTLGYRALEALLGPTATIDTDTILMMVDPRWELTHQERRLELAGYQCSLLAESFLTAGFACVIVGGNGLHTPEEINDMVALLLRFGEVEVHARQSFLPMVLTVYLAGNEIGPGHLR